MLRDLSFKFRPNIHIPEILTLVVPIESKVIKELKKQELKLMEE